MNFPRLSPAHVPFGLVRLHDVDEPDPRLGQDVAQVDGGGAAQAEQRQAHGAGLRGRHGRRVGQRGRSAGLAAQLRDGTGESGGEKRQIGVRDDFFFPFLIIYIYNYNILGYRIYDQGVTTNYV